MLSLSLSLAADGLPLPRGWRHGPVTSITQIATDFMTAAAAEGGRVRYGVVCMHEFLGRNLALNRVYPRVQVMSVILAFNNLKGDYLLKIFP